MKLLATFGFLLLAFLTVAEAQSVTGSANVRWVLPTAGCTLTVTPCDNVPLTGTNAITAVELYVSTSPIPDASSMAPSATLANGATTTNYTTSVPNGSTMYLRLKIRNANGVSAFSTQATKVINVGAVPGPATNVTFTFEITPAP